jgi:hypothetical protein
LIRRVVCLRFLLPVKDPPVDAIDVEMEVTIPAVRLPHVTLSLSAKLLTQQCIVCTAILAPGVVLLTPHIDLVKTGHSSLTAKEWIDQISVSIDATEIEMEGVFGIRRGTACIPPHANAAVDRAR